jgi:hypothetical protein
MFRLPTAENAENPGAGPLVPAVLCVLCVLGGDGGAVGAGPRIRVAPAAGRIEVTGLDPTALRELSRRDWDPEQWARLFAVFVEGGKADPSRPPVLGTYRVVDGVLTFEPRFPLQPGVRYRTVFDPSRLPGKGPPGEPITATFRLPKPRPAAAAVVTHVYPSADRLPENQLKFYLHFSSPMSRGEAYRHVHLLRASGEEVELPFLELAEELWDREGRRFTLFFDPGRIKRGLKPREEVGPALEQGKTYTLVIDRDWTDAEGNPLRESYRKTFHVLAPEDQPPDPRTWELRAPPAGTAEPVRVRFPKALDHALLERLLWVTDAQGRRIAGEVTVPDRETGWKFTPRQAWAAGRYRLVADTRLEDLAGNRIGRPFEVDELHPVQRRVTAATVAVPFEVKPAGGGTP